MTDCLFEYLKVDLIPKAAFGYCVEHVSIRLGDISQRG